MQQAKMIDKFKIILEEVETPSPKDNEVLVKVKYSGICGSDRIMLKGESFFYSPIVMGHEITGTVASEGKKYRKGERVIVLPLVYCKKCNFCLNKDFNLCEELAFIGDKAYNGGFAEYIVVDEDNLFKTPEKMTDESAVLVEPASVAYHGVNLIDPESSKKVMILGTGLIGLISIRILKNAYGINDITAVDLIDKRLDSAMKSGATRIVNLSKKGWDNKIANKETLDDKPFQSGEYDAVLDFASTSQSTNIAISNLKKRGKLISIGLPKGDITIKEIPFSAISANEICIKGSYCYNMNDFRDVIDAIVKETITVDDLISAKFDLKDTPIAFEEWDKNYSDWYKVLIKP